MAFKFQRKTVFLTYPHCTLAKEDVRDYFDVLYGLVEYIVAKEAHQDGTPHLHCWFKFKVEVKSRDPRLFDVHGFHPNIQTPNKSDGVARVKAYCMKDGDYITNQQLLGKRAQLMSDALAEGLTPKFVRANPEIMTLNFSSIMNWIRFTNGFFVPPRRTLPKLRHIWLSGPANTGKTTWKDAFISLHDHPFIIPKNNDFTGVGIHHDVLYVDEFKGNCPLQVLNELCDGCCKVNTKGGSAVIGQPLIVVVSNFWPEVCYPNADQMEIAALRARFIIYDSSVRLPKFPTREL